MAEDESFTSKPSLDEALDALELSQSSKTDGKVSPEELQARLEKVDAASAPSKCSPTWPRTWTFMEDDGVCEVSDESGYYVDCSNVDMLTEGNALFKFHCGSGGYLGSEECKIVDSCINLTDFDDEMKENNVPLVDVYDFDDAEQYTIIVVKVSYTLPNTKLSDFTPELIASQGYSKACIPNNPTIFETNDPITFRMTRSVIPWVFSITVQWRVSVIEDKEAIERLSQVHGLRIHKALLLERTKRNVSVVDATRKAKTLLLYSSVNGGTLVTQLSVICNTSIPTVATPLISGLGALGANEGAQTADMTRAYLNKLRDDGDLEPLEEKSST